MSLRILFSHNKYQQRGGEDSVVDEEIDLLRANGHEVVLYSRDNDEINEMGILRIAQDTIWSGQTSRDINKVINDFQPDIIHSHNTFPLISPSLYWVASKNKIPVVQTLHNFRLFCLQAMLLRNNKICEDCLGKSIWRGIMRKCYRGSFSQSALLAGSLSTHRLLGTYTQKVSRYIALNDFCKKLFIKGGLPANRISVKPNFVDFADQQAQHKGNALFVGRLSEEKGVDTLVQAVTLKDGIAVDFVGSGPLETSLSGINGVNMHGWLDKEDIFEKMKNAAYLVMPSIWYENFPRTLVEAFACGLPVIASRLGAMAEIVEDGHTGLLFDPDSAKDLREKMDWANNNPDKLQKMGQNARNVYEEHYTPERNYTQLINIYNEAISTTHNK